MRRLILFAFLLSLSMAVLAEPAAVTLKKFRQQTREHRMRVMDYAILALNQFPEKFPVLTGLSEEIRLQIVESYFYLHDLPKMMTSEQLRRFGYENQASILQRLHKMYGVNVRPDAVDDLNHIEAVMKSIIMERKIAKMPETVQALLNPIMMEIELLERAVDVGDTKVNRSQELGFKREQGAARKYFLDRGDAQAAEIAGWVEETQTQNPRNLQCRHLLGIRKIIK